MRKILVLRGGALGDFIVTLPALAALRKRWPSARIELAGNPTAAALGRARGLIDAVHSQHEARWSALFGDAPLPADFGAWLATFDLVVNYWPDSDGDLRRRFPLHAGQTFLTAPAMPAISPAAAHYCAALGPLAITTENYFYSLKAARVGDDAPSSIAIHPGSGSPQKNWPLARWAEVCAWLKAERHAELLIVSGEAEAADALATFGRVARQLPLEALVDELSRCRLFLGHDSGISHLAAACEVPSILLFGPTDPAMWAPPAAHVTTLKRANDMAAIAVADVIAEILKPGGAPSPHSSSTQTVP